MSINFGLPKREVKQEMFPDVPVVTLEKHKGKGHGNRFTFNSKSIELLDTIPGLSKVYFAVDDESKEVYIGKYESEDSFLMTGLMMWAIESFCILGLFVISTLSYEA